MRRCAKISCSLPAAATTALRYAERILWVGDLLAEPDPNLIDLCAQHADALVPPRGWNRLDERASAQASPVPAPLASRAG
jgi:hypothetical protein